MTPATRSENNRFGTGRDWVADFPDPTERERAKVLTMKTILLQLAYPRYGPPETDFDRQHFADLTMSFFCVEDLE